MKKGKTISAISIILCCLLLFSACQSINNDMESSTPARADDVTTTIVTTPTTETSANTTTTTTESTTTTTTQSTLVATTQNTQRTMTAKHQALSYTFAPEDAWPDKEKRRLSIAIADTSVSLDFAYAYTKAQDKSVYWYFTGKSSEGKSLECAVADGKYIAYVHTGIKPGTWSLSANYRDSLFAALTATMENGGLSGLSFDQAYCAPVTFMNDDGKTQCDYVDITGVSVSEPWETVSLRFFVCRVDGQLCVQQIYVYTQGELNEESVPDCFIPNWC